MEAEDYKKYNILENILQKVNQKYVALPPDETKRNNKLLQVTDQIIQTLRSKSVLFDNLYQNKFYGGSFYDDLKVGNPTEFDLDCLLCLPKIVEPTVEVSDKPGYVHIVLNKMKALQKIPIENEKYIGLDKLLDGNRLSTKKVKSWMEGLMVSAATGKASITIDDTKKCDVKYTIVKSGPALTLKLQGDLDGQRFKIDIDLVPCFTFFADQWPKQNYKPNPSKSKNTFFVVPKSPGEEYPLHWRLSFQEQERELLSGFPLVKPTIRLLKKIRDRHQHKISSYYIKTIFLWELEVIDKDNWKKTQSFALVMMLRRYAKYIEEKNIPYYWNKSNNLIADLSDITALCIANKIKHIADHIDRICDTKTNMFDVLPYFLASDEYDPETLKNEVPISKKLLKQSKSGSSQELLLPSPIISPFSPIIVCVADSPQSSTSSSFEEVNANMLNEASEANVNSSKLDLILSEQKRMCGMLETIISKIGQCEKEIQHLKFEFAQRNLDNEIGRQELLGKIYHVDEKIDSIKKGVSSSVDDDNDKKSETSALDDLLGLGSGLDNLLNC